MKNYNQDTPENFFEAVFYTIIVASVCVYGLAKLVSLAFNN